MNLAARLRAFTVIAKLDWWDRLSKQEQYDYLKAHPYSRIKLHAVNPRSRVYDIIDTETGEHLGNVSSNAQGHPFIDAVMLKKQHKGKGLAKHIYNAVQHRLKRPLIPSPLGLSDDATRVWQKRLAAMPPEHAKGIIDEAYQIGLGYGIKPQHIMDRLVPLLAKHQSAEK